jgi:uncharacterized protein (DUF2461 family)
LDWIDQYMKCMDTKAARQNVVLGDAFIPGDFEDIVYRSGNKKVDLQDYLSKILRKEKFYRVKTDYLAKKRPRTVNKLAERDDNNSFANGGILINITINKCYVFHKSLREIEEFFTKLNKRLDDNPILLHLIQSILSRESIKMSTENSVLSGDQFFN